MTGKAGASARPRTRTVPSYANRTTGVVARTLPWFTCGGAHFQAGPDSARLGVKDVKV